MYIIRYNSKIIDSSYYFIFTNSFLFIFGMASNNSEVSSFWKRLNLQKLKESITKEELTLIVWLLSFLNKP